MDFSSVKDKLTNLNISKATLVLNNCCNRYFLHGLIVTTLIYLALFTYINLTSENTLNSIKKLIPSKTTPVIFVRNTIGSTIHDGTNKNDADIKDLIIDGLYQKTAQGLLPTIRKSDNLTSFRAYQHPFNLNNIPADKPIITFVIQDYGLSKEQSKTILDILPSEVSLILNPYVELPNEWIKMAQTSGHEVWLGLPIQNNKMEDIGENAVFHHISLPEKIAALYKIMTKTQGYLGLASFTDEQIESAPEHYKQFMNKVYERGLGFLELNPNSEKLLETNAFNLGAPYIKADTEIITVKGDTQSFDSLEDMAKRNGHVVAVISPYPNTIKNLAVWIEKIGKTDYTIAPVSVIYDLPLYQNNNQKTAEPITKNPLKIQDHEEPEHHDSTNEKHH